MWMRGECQVSWNNIFLTGLMGAGKTSVGGALAQKLGWKSSDLDCLIQQAEQRSILEIFEQDGEANFRKLESDLLKTISQEHRQVVSLGGGSLMAMESFDTVSVSGVLIYLKANTITLVNRLLAQAQSRPRPLLGPPDLFRWKARLQQLLEVRQSAYEEADLSIETDFLSPDQVAQCILDKIPSGAFRSVPMPEVDLVSFT